MGHALFLMHFVTLIVQGQSSHCEISYLQNPNFRVSASLRLNPRSPRGPRSNDSCWFVCIRGFK